jgi:hypothetical protein
MTTTIRKKQKRKQSFSKKYVPDYLSSKDKKKTIQELNKSIESYKLKKYYVRKPIKGFRTKKSDHLEKVTKIYGIKKIYPSNELAKATKCKKIGLEKIVKKGQGAYFSQGSRPSQTPHSWGNARLASAITGGKAAVRDYHILEKYCQNNSKALQLAKLQKNK